MKKTYINVKLDDFRNLFNSYNLHKKKVSALENMSLCFSFRHKDYLALIKKILEDGFLDKEADAFLSHLIKKYEEENDLDYLLWTHRTHSLKRRMGVETTVKAPKDQQLFFDWEKIPKIPTGTYPVELIAAQKTQYARI